MSVESVTGQRAPGSRTDEPQVILTEAARVIRDEWRELCQWDPALPPSARPPMADRVVSEVLTALERPQPIGWGTDPEVESVAERFSEAVGPVDTVIGMLICLREAVHRHLVSTFQGEELLERQHRMQIVIDRAISVAAIRSARGLEERAYNDPVTGLSNRWALERDLAREIGRADRHRHHLGVVVVDLDGLKFINDTKGHAAGDDALRAMAQAMREASRRGDVAYRVGGDEFVIVLNEIDSELEMAAADAVVTRMRELGAPTFSWGAAIYPVDGRNAEELIDVADRRLMRARDRRGHVRR
jgi:diguanylate cyclase (GGDEF)-like protein